MVKAERFVDDLFDGPGATQSDPGISLPPPADCERCKRNSGVEP